MRIIDYGRQSYRVETANGPGLCASLWHPWMTEHLLVKPVAYQPCTLSYRMIFGIETIQAHLVAVHGLSSDRVGRLRGDNAYRLHDLLHEEPHT